MPTLRPFRQYAENDVINLFAYQTGVNSVNKGTFVKIASGWTNSDNLGYDALNGTVFQNTVSLRYSVKPRVTATTSGDAPLGMMLMDVREYDENGEWLLYHPRKAAEMQAVISGQAVPIVTRGIFLYSGISGTVAAGSNLCCGYNGELTTNVNAGTATVVGKCLGPKDGNGHVLIRIDC